jgi:hypothetical protein
MEAVQRSDAAEDDSSGHSLMHDPAARRIQERFIDDARDVRPLRDVIDDLAYAMTDPSDEVRNNAMRALAVIARAASAAPQRMPIPVEPFIGLLDSPVWTDRNKASLALVSLSERRDPALLTTLRHRALGPLVDPRANRRSNGRRRRGRLDTQRSRRGDQRRTRATVNTHRRAIAEGRGWTTSG